VKWIKMLHFMKITMNQIYDLGKQKTKVFTRTARMYGYNSQPTPSFKLKYNKPSLTWFYN
jgi:hypothetical protein